MIKKWTVILIPHDRGERRSFNMSDVHVWVAAGTLLLLCFTSAVFFQRSRTTAERTRALESDYRALEADLNSPEVNEAFDAKWREREASLRGEFEDRDSALSRELSRVYDLEKEVRIITGLPTQIVEGDDVPLPPADGEGGRLGEFSDGAVFTDNEALLPPLWSCKAIGRFDDAGDTTSKGQPGKHAAEYGSAARAHCTYAVDLAYERCASSNHLALWSTHGSFDEETAAAQWRGYSCGLWFANHQFCQRHGDFLRLPSVSRALRKG